MKNGVIKITAFELLNEIARKHSVKAQAWAAAAWGDKKFASRISELRKLQTQHTVGDAAKVGRVLSAEKLQSLLNGLKTILGGDLVRKDLVDKIATVKSEREKNLILIMVADDKDQKAIRLFLEALVDTKQ